MLKYFLYVVLGVFVYSYTYAQGQLIFAIDLVRHGDRTPLIASPGMQQIWPQGVGQLTPKGMHQEFELGKILRERYVNQTHLLPPNYDTNSMNVRSSAMPRTMMSAQSLLFGLYPLGTGPSLNTTTFALPEGFQPIPINTVPREQDSLLIPNHDKALYKKLLEAYILNQPEWIQKDQELKDKYPQWSKIAGIQITNLFELIYFSDRLMIERLYDIPIPVGLQQKEAARIIEAGRWASMNIANHPKLAAMVGSRLAQAITQEFKITTEQSRPLKYLLFVAHDTTIAAQLSLLGQSIDDIPYTSQINYSLFDMGSNYEVRVTFNQKPLIIEECGGNSCSLDDFINLVNARCGDE